MSSDYPTFEIRFGKGILQQGEDGKPLIGKKLITYGAMVVLITGEGKPGVPILTRDFTIDPSRQLPDGFTVEKLESTLKQDFHADVLPVLRKMASRLLMLSDMSKAELAEIEIEDVDKKKIIYPRQGKKEKAKA